MYWGLGLGDSSIVIVRGFGAIILSKICVWETMKKILPVFMSRVPKLNTGINLHLVLTSCTV